MTDEGKILNQGEVDALLSMINQGEVVVVEQDTGPKKGPQGYDFRRPERVARDQLRAISTLHEVFARSLQAYLSARMRTVVELRVQVVDQLTYSEFINSLPNPTVFVVVAAEPLEGNFIFEVNPIIAFPILERLLGSGRAAGPQPERPLTDLEWGLLEPVVVRVLEMLGESWSKIAPVRFRISGHESNPQLVPLLSSNESVVSVVLELVIGENRGYINLCIPVVSIEALMEKIVSLSWYASRRGGAAPTQDQAIGRSVSHAEVETVTILAETQMKIDEVRALTRGTVVRTEHPLRHPIVLYIEGVPKFLGEPCALKDRKGIKILRTLTAEEVRRIQASV